MPWEVSSVVEQRSRFVVLYQSGEWRMASLCRQFGIERKTGYKILARWEQEPELGLGDRSRAPHRHPNQTSKSVSEEILALRAAHPSWGPRKLRAWLSQRKPSQAWPAATTMGQILQQAGLNAPRLKRRRTPPFTQPFAEATQPNDTWCVDFKGWFRTQDGARVDPFTMTDAASRYLLRCQVVPKTDTAAVSAICRAAFRQYGLPSAIRSDNGAPFGSRAVAGLSRLSVEWMKLGIVPERIKAGHPEQNGRHERMHRTLKAETTRPPAATVRQQQCRFDRFRHVYNVERPHEALRQQTPDSLYQPSQRRCPDKIPEPEYDTGLTVRRVAPRGQIFWKGQDLFLTKALAGERIALEQVDEQLYCVLFAGFPLALLDEQIGAICPLPEPENKPRRKPQANPEPAPERPPEPEKPGAGNQEIAQNAIP